MPDDRWTDAELDLVAHAWDSPTGMLRDGPPSGMERIRAAAVLEALVASNWRPAREFLPAAGEAIARTAARVRAQVAEEIARAIEAVDPLHCGCGCGCAAVARTHTTTTEEDHDDR